MANANDDLHGIGRAPKPARIVMATFEYGVFRLGGLATAVTALCGELDRSLYQPVVVLPRCGVSVPWRSIASRSYEKFAVEIFDHDGTEVWLLSNSIFDDSIYSAFAEVAGPNGRFPKVDAYGLALAELLPDLDASVLHLHDSFGWRALPVARDRHVPSVLTVHCLHAELDCVVEAERNAVERVDVVATVSESYRLEHESFFGLARKTVIVPNGADPSYWSAETAPGGTTAAARAGRLSNLLARHSMSIAPTFAYIGRLDRHQKGVDVLIAAYHRLVASHLIDFNLLIFGDGVPEMREELLAMAPRDDGHFCCSINFLSAAEVRTILGAVDFVIIPSRFEPFGLIQLEALGMGSVVIASRTGGLQEVMIDIADEGGFGKLVTPGDDAELADAMLEFSRLKLSSSGRLEELRTRGRARASEFTARATAAKYENVYSDIMRGEPY